MDSCFGSVGKISVWKFAVARGRIGTRAPLAKPILFANQFDRVMLGSCDCHKNHNAPAWAVYYSYGNHGKNQSPLAADLIAPTRKFSSFVEKLVMCAPPFALLFSPNDRCLPSVHTRPPLRLFDVTHCATRPRASGQSTHSAGWQLVNAWQGVHRLHESITAPASQAGLRASACP